MAEAIGSPIRDHAIREPYVPIYGSGPPGAGDIEIGDADNSGRDSGQRYRGIHTTIALDAPGIELIRIGRAALIETGIRISLDDKPVRWCDRGDALPSAVVSPFAAANGDDGCVSGFVHFDAIGAGTQQSECDLRRVHFIRFVLIKASQAD